MLGLKTSLQRAGRAKRVAINWRSISIALASMEILFVRRITLQVLTACEWPMSAVQPTFECPGDGVFERPLLAELGRPPPSAHGRRRSTRSGLFASSRAVIQCDEFEIDRWGKGRKLAAVSLALPIGPCRPRPLAYSPRESGIDLVPC